MAVNAPAALQASVSDASALVVRVRKSYAPRGGAGFVLDVDVTLPPGITIVFGPSGSGKTTLLDCIAGLARPDRGRIAAAAAWFDSDSGIDLPPAQRSVGYVFQTLALFPHLTVEGNVRFGLHRISPAQQRQRVDAILESFRIAHLRGRLPGEISGGERQRAALARALVTEPRVLLLDEPLSALDAATKSRIVDDLRAWNARQRIPILYVTHSREEVFALGERVIALDQGKVVAQGTPLEVLEAPRRETLAHGAGLENLFTAQVTAWHEDIGTMTCRLEGSGIELEVPLARVTPGSTLRLGFRAGDVLLAAQRPEKISARNLLPGRVVSLTEADYTVLATVDCGAPFQARLTRGAVRSLNLEPGAHVWLILKTHSCHVLAE